MRALRKRKFQNLKLKSVCMALLVLVSACSSATNIEPSTSTVTSTTIRDGLGVTLGWLKRFDEQVGQLKLEKLDRLTSLMTLSGHKTALIDFERESRDSGDERISTCGADWIASMIQPLQNMIESITTNGKDRLSVALGEYNYLRSRSKAGDVVDCLADGKIPVSEIFGSR